MLTETPPLKVQSVLWDFVVFMIALVGAFIGLYYTAAHKIDLANLAGGKENKARSEMVDGRLFTAFTVDTIKAVIDQHHVEETAHPDTRRLQRIVWLGNSQLHYINQYREGDHLSPYWLRMAWADHDRIEPLGLSLANASFQEFLVLSRYAFMKMAVDLLIIELVFDDLREEGLRSDFGYLLTAEVADETRRMSREAETIISRFFLVNKGAGTEKTESVLSGTVQEPAEKWLNDNLSTLWPLWASRAQIEGNARLVIYNMRNAVFGIKPTTVRRMIRARFDMNMAALRDILVDCRSRGIPALVYIAPIRQDKPIPYDLTEYSLWKKEVHELSEENGAHLVNLETTVPGELWGSYIGEDIDFMHFRGPGHRLVAEALRPYAERLLLGSER
jgi:hypothetical protein